MSKEAVIGALWMLPLFAVFAVFVGIFYFRSKYNEAHPSETYSPEKRRRAKIVQWIVIVLLVTPAFYVHLAQKHFAPSWAVTFWLTFFAFFAGLTLGNHGAGRKVT